MSASTRRMIGWVVVAVGVVIAVVGAFADKIGLGGEGPDEFGGKQVAALIVGIVIAVIGLVVALWPARSKQTEAT
jgi:membrane protease YdiL (CAAX protease family)